MTYSISARVLSKTAASFLLLLPLAGCGDDSDDTGDNGEADEGDDTGTDDDTDGDVGTDDDTGEDTGTNGDTGEDAEPVDLGTAANYAILAKSGISTVPLSAIVGNLGLSPADSTFITGFSLTVDATNLYSTSAQVTGRVYAADYEPPTPSALTTAISDMESAFADAAGRAADVTELGAGNIGGMTLEPGVYQWGTGVTIPTDVTLSGSSSDVWIFQIAQDLELSTGTEIVLAGGAVPEHVFWQVSGLVDIGTTAHLEGVVLTLTAITLETGASVDGRLLAQTAVNLDGNTVIEP